MAVVTESGRIVAGRYRLSAVIGRGGMGVVWRASDELLNRDVAVKEIIWPPYLTDQEQRVACGRATREAQMAARLSHQNVIRIYDIVEEDGHPWIVMELFPHRSLRDLVTEDGPLPPAEAAQIGLGILAALRAAHAEGIVHRDVKPANVLVGPDGRVVLTDFGIARAAGSPTLTATGAIIGSPSYIAPERARGAPSGPQADLWGLGASLYTAVEGRPPFQRDGALPTLTAVVADEPDQPDHAGPLWPVISGLLRKDPETRLRPDETEQMLLPIAGNGDVGRFVAPPPRLSAPRPQWFPPPLPTVPEPAAPRSATVDSVILEPSAPDPADPDPADPDPADPDPADPDPADPDPADPEPADPEPAASAPGRASLESEAPPSAAVESAALEPMAPESAVPDSAAPAPAVESAAPEPMAPESAVPDSAAPAPESAVPESDAPRPAVVESAGPEPAVPAPESAIPEPEIFRWAVVEPAVPESAVPESDAPRSAVVEPAGPEPAVPAPESAIPEPKIFPPAVAESAGPEPAVPAPEPDIPEPEIFPPAVAESAVPEPAVPAPEPDIPESDAAAEWAVPGSSVPGPTAYEIAAAEPAEPAELAEPAGPEPAQLEGAAAEPADLERAVPDPAVTEPVAAGAAANTDLNLAGPPALHRTPSKSPRTPAASGRRRARGRLVALAALCVIAAAVIAVTLTLTLTGSRPQSAASPGKTTGPASHPAASGGTSAPASGSAGASSQPTPAPSAPTSASGAGYGALPAGYYRFTNSTGFSIGVPDGWVIQHVGHYVYINDPSNPNIYLLIDQSDQPKPDPLADWQQQAANRAPGYPDYHLIRLASVYYPQAEKAADWEFTYDRDGVLVQILNRNVLANAKHAYALYWSTPESDWSTDYHYFQAFAATFIPAPA